MKQIEETKKIRAMKLDDLEKEVKKAEREYALTNLKVKAGKQSDFSAVSKLRKNVARMKTIIIEKQSGVSNG